VSAILLLADLMTQREKHPRWAELVGGAARMASKGDRSAAGFLSMLGLKVRRSRRRGARRKAS
jgi:hypothetical protein